MLRVNVVTLFPEVLIPMLESSIIGRAVEAKLVEFRLVQLRDFAHDKHQTVDDYPFGGGAGMVLKPEPMFEAVESLGVRNGPILLLSARGERFSHPMAVRYSLGQDLTILCGHYKDVDQRVAEGLGVEEVSVGDFVLSGGEPAALCVIDAVVRLLPGVMGDEASAHEESFESGLLEHPQYTRPKSFEGAEIPEVLLSGDHEAIKRFKRKAAEELTRSRRPDLWERYERSGKRQKD